MSKENHNKLTVIVKVTHECNLDCLYCYTNHAIEEAGSINVETIYNIITKFSKYNATFGSTKFIWHGGEHLLISLKIFEKVIEIQKNIKGHKFINCIQTNGTLIRNELIDFWSKHKFRVGISIDGDPTSHNLNRPYKDNSPSFEDMFLGYQKVRKKNLGGGGLCVFNKNTSKDIKKLYFFFKTHHINPKLILQVPSGKAYGNKDLNLKNSEYLKKLKELFDLWFFDNERPIIYIEPFMGIMYNLSLYRNKKNNKIRHNSCTFMGNCLDSFISVTPNGFLSPCGRFSGDANFNMGNINHDSLDEILSKSKIAKQFYDRLNTTQKECSNCTYHTICNAGCAHNALSINGSILKKDGFCHVYKGIFSHIEQSMQRELANE